MTKTKQEYSFLNYLQSEINAGYHLENDEETFTARRDKVYTFFRIPYEIEKFFSFGFFQCADSFFFVLTFLPIRFAMAVWYLLMRACRILCGKLETGTGFLKPAEKIDLIKGFLVLTCCYIVSYMDTSIIYHNIKTQSTMKLYIFYNMLDIADRLMSAFGQDTLDAVFWTANEPKGRKREHFGVFFHVFISIIYVSIHAAIVLVQALTLNVAINSENKGLLTIVISNNFIEIKGSVFKKYDRTNLLQISCSDVRERFHQSFLLFVVVMLTMKEYSWKEERLLILLQICFLICVTEVFIDWLKHAFITRFNEIPVDAYRDYTLLIASDVIMCKQTNAFSDHSDLVARRMGFIPLPLAVIFFRILSQTLRFKNFSSLVLLFVGFLCLLSFRILNGIVILGKACDLIQNAELQKAHNELKAENNPWKSAVTSYCERVQTPLRARRRTVSREDAARDAEEALKTVLKESIERKQEKIETVSAQKSLALSTNQLPAQKPLPSSTNDLLAPKSLSSSTNQSPAQKPFSIATNQLPTEDSEATDLYPLESSGDQSSVDDGSPSAEEISLGFLEDSRCILRANSMINLADIGIAEGDHDEDSSHEETEHFENSERIQPAVDCVAENSAERDRDEEESSQEETECCIDSEHIQSAVDLSQESSSIEVDHIALSKRSEANIDLSVTSPESSNSMKTNSPLTTNLSMVSPDDFSPENSFMSSSLDRKELSSSQFETSVTDISESDLLPILRKGLLVSNDSTTNGT